jgi:hypothetical protein
MHIYGIDIIYGIGYLIEIKKLDLAYLIGVVIFTGHDLLNLVVPVIVGDGFAATCRYMGAPGSRPSPWWLNDVPSWLIVAKWQ